jgi:hypothetical protein
MQAPLAGEAAAAGKIPFEIRALRPLLPPDSPTALERPVNEMPRRNALAPSAHTLPESVIPTLHGGIGVRAAQSRRAIENTIP